MARVENIISSKKMKSKIFIITLVLFFLGEINPTIAKPRRPKSCAPKVLLPGHKKPVNCNKARKMKNAYF